MTDSKVKVYSATEIFYKNSTSNYVLKEDHDRIVKDLEACIGTIRGLTGCKVENVKDLPVEDHSREIIGKFKELESANTLLRQQIETIVTHFKDLVRDCKWYADKGTDQERHHFLKVETQGNYLDLALKSLEK